MSLVSRDFSVQGSPEKVWAFLNDPVEIGKCIPGCEQVLVSTPDESRWKLKISLGVISRRIDAKVKVVEREAQKKLRLQIQSIDGDLSGDWQIELIPQDQATQIKFNAKLKASGAFQWIFNQIIKSELDKMVSQFAACVSLRMQS